VDLFAELPPGRSPHDKQVLAFFADSAPAGCADLVRGYPEPQTAYLGLFLFREGFQGRGLGPRALTHVAGLAREWNCKTLRLAVIATNVRGQRFWLREGFVEVQRRALPGYTGDAIIMQRPLSAAVS
jgi:GNAT superfamily N-acetyltransferase